MIEAKIDIKKISEEPMVVYFFTKARREEKIFLKIQEKEKINAEDCCWLVYKILRLGCDTWSKIKLEQLYEVLKKEKDVFSFDESQKGQLRESIRGGLGVNYIQIPEHPDSFFKHPIKIIDGKKISSFKRKRRIVKIKQESVNRVSFGLEKLKKEDIFLLKSIW